MIAVTGATGQLGTLVIEDLLKRVSADQIIAAVRNPAKAKSFADRGVQVREADYARPETMESAFAGAAKVLLISSNELGRREAQHKTVIDAAKAAGVQLFVYTSLLRADSSTLELAADHRVTEKYLRESGMSFSLLRNGWYIENHTPGIAPAVQHGALIGASKEGRFAAAARADYAAAAGTVLTGAGHENTVYELGGDVPYTRVEFAAEVSKQLGKAIPYNDLPEAAYRDILATFLPPELASVIADAEAKAAYGELDDDTHTLSRLIGRNTTPLADAIANALRVD